MAKYSLLSVGLISRLLLILSGNYIDSQQDWQLKYTDVDYKVFTDAAHYITEGQSPYHHPTYRYTPMIAWLLTPNIFAHDSFGKLLFSLTDIACGFIIYSIVVSRSGRIWASRSLALWLFNPLTAVISTRGNAESIITLAVLLTLHYHLRRHFMKSGLLLGLAIHLKIYPIIYLPVLYASSGPYTTFWQTVKPTIGRLRFLFATTCSLLTTSAICFLAYGWPFVEQTYLYHVTRKDVKHNFSPYFYPLYLSGSGDRIWSLAAFLPQCLVIAALSLRFRSNKDLASALFLTTFAFVTFNKVVTSQYFLWYISLLPLCLQLISFVGKLSTICAASSWLAAQALWLNYAYQLEFLGRDVFLQVWLASLLFFAVNISLLAMFVRAADKHSKQQ